MWLRAGVLAEGTLSTDRGEPFALKDERNMQIVSPKSQRNTFIFDCSLNAASARLGRCTGFFKMHDH